MKRYFILLLINFCALSLFAQNGKNEKAILQVLDQQIIAWNKGDIEGFMQGYWNNEGLTFVGTQGPQYGWETTLNRYKTTYDSPEKMGTLKFDILKMERHKRKTYQVLGKWYLTRSVGDVGGAFTLIVKKIKGEWKIVYDHTS